MTFKSQITLLLGKLRRKLEKCIEITDLIYESAKHTESEICQNSLLFSPVIYILRWIIIVSHYKELILEHRLEILFKCFVTEKTQIDDETMNITKEIQFISLL